MRACVLRAATHCRARLHALVAPNGAPHWRASSSRQSTVNRRGTPSYGMRVLYPELRESSASPPAAVGGATRCMTNRLGTTNCLRCNTTLVLRSTAHHEQPAYDHITTSRGDAAVGRGSRGETWKRQ